MHLHKPLTRGFFMFNFSPILALLSPSNTFNVGKYQLTYFKALKRLYLRRFFCPIFCRLALCRWKFTFYGGGKN